MNGMEMPQHAKAPEAPQEKLPARNTPGMFDESIEEEMKKMGITEGEVKRAGSTPLKPEDFKRN